MDTKLHPVGCTSMKLRQLMRRVGRHYDTELAKAGLKVTQYSLLSCVFKLGPMRPVDIARVMGLDASTLTRNLKPLVAAGWLTLEAGPDGRSRSVAITPAGREKRQEAQRRWRVAQETLNETVGVERVGALHTLVDDWMVRLAPDGDAEGESDE
jgi:DNA-binding MarR family transcriptional regulator